MTEHADSASAVTSAQQKLARRRHSMGISQKTARQISTEGRARRAGSSGLGRCRLSPLSTKHLRRPLHSYSRAGMAQVPQEVVDSSGMHVSR